MDPERVAPGRPASGVRDIDVSRDCPFLIQHTDAPEPRCKTMRFVWFMGYGKLVSSYSLGQTNTNFV